MRQGLRSAVALLLALLAVTACGAQEPHLDDAALRAMIDSMLPGIERASGLQARRSVRFAVQPTAEVRAFIEEQLEADLVPGEFEGMERAYRAFGLLPESLDLRAMLLDLYTEQVVGYYDPRTDQLYVVEGVRRDAAAPVVAHELVHALQDQHVDLESLIAPERGNDRQIAAQAAAEGQATLVMITLQAEETTGRPMDPGQLPDLAEMLRPAMEAENARFPVFRDAPRIIRETMLFPYLEGAAFVQALHRAGMAPVPFGDALPQSTEQVRNPGERFLRRRDEPTELRLDEPSSEWATIYENTLGQLEVSILLTEHLGAAPAAAEGWDGDRFVLLEGPEGEVLVWYSVWDDEAAADRFAESYRRVLTARGRTGTVTRQELDGRPIVRILEADAPVSAAAVPQLRTLTEQPPGPEI